jgi:7-carboxy-7-deazaguanine synthase
VSYLVNDLFYTIQGEGYWTGRAAVFVRFARCNLWTGREEDRASAICNFCDTDFVYSERWELDDLVKEIFESWPQTAHKPMVVFTGGEPLLQLDEELVLKLKDLGFYVAVETNGTMTVPEGVDWVCVSPKILTRLVVAYANELKLVYPQADVRPDRLLDFKSDHKWLSPMDGPDYEANLKAAIEYVKSDPVWRLNIQTHKFIGVR